MPSQGDVRRALDVQDGAGQRGQDDSAAGDVVGREEIERAGIAVDEILAGDVEFFEQIHGVVAAGAGIAAAEPVSVRLGERDAALVGVDGADADRVAAPVETPVAFEPDGGGGFPARGPVAFVLEHGQRLGGVVAPWRGAAFDDLGDVRPVVVWPARERHALAVEEQLGERRRAFEAVGQGAVFGDAEARRSAQRIVRPLRR